MVKGFEIRSALRIDSCFILLECGVNVLWEVMSNKIER